MCVLLKTASSLICGRPSHKFHAFDLALYYIGHMHLNTVSFVEKCICHTHLLAFIEAVQPKNISKNSKSTLRNSC